MILERMREHNGKTLWNVRGIIIPLQHPISSRFRPASSGYVGLTLIQNTWVRLESKQAGVVLLVIAMCIGSIILFCFSLTIMSFDTCFLSFRPLNHA